MRHPCLVLTLCLGALFSAAEDAPATPADNFKQWCAVCHDAPTDEKTPATDAIRRMSPARINHALRHGAMRQYVGFMTFDEVAALAVWLPNGQTDVMAENASCPGPAATTAEIDRWGFDAGNKRHQTNTAIRANNVRRLRLQWAFAAPRVTAMRSQPAVSEDTVFLPTQDGDLFALDRQTGCIRWRYRADAPLRTAATLGVAGRRPALFVGDQGATVRAIDARTGTLIWQQAAGLFPASITTGAPVQHGDTLFVPLSAFGVALAAEPGYECCKSHGAVRALDAATGKIKWTAHMAPPANPTY